MKLSTEKELKKEIVGMPPKEKDKLLLRLIGKDKVLTEHLHFILLEGEHDLQRRVSELKDHIRSVTGELDGVGKGTAKEALRLLRKLATAVNHNFRVTRAAFEDVELRVFLLTEISTTFRYQFFGSSKDYEQVFYNFYLKTSVVTLNKYFKLHDDLQFDLRDAVNKWLKKIYAGKMKDGAIQLNIPDSV